MGHHITGIVAHRDTLRRLETNFARQSCFELADGLAFLPLDDENLDEVVGLHAGNALGTFEYLTEHLFELLCVGSRNGELIYVETHYHGGVGGQGAAVFRDGTIVFGPKSGDGSAINEALSQIGVTPHPEQFDAFAAVGLDRFRSNEDFREKGTSV